MRLNEIKENREEGSQSWSTAEVRERRNQQRRPREQPGRERESQEDAVWEPQCPEERQPPAVPDTGEAG